MAPPAPLDSVGVRLAPSCLDASSLDVSITIPILVNPLDWSAWAHLPTWFEAGEGLDLLLFGRKELGLASPLSLYHNDEVGWGWAIWRRKTEVTVRWRVRFAVACVTVSGWEDGGGATKLEGWSAEQVRQHVLEAAQEQGEGEKVVVLQSQAYFDQPWSGMATTLGCITDRMRRNADEKRHVYQRFDEALEAATGRWKAEVRDQVWCAKSERR